MAELLQYRASNSAVFYVPPKRFEARALTIGAGVAGLVIAIGACVYAFILPELLSIYLRLFFSLDFSIAVGITGGLAVRHGRVHPPLISAVVAMGLAGEALYVSWLFWIHGWIVQVGGHATVWSLFEHPVVLFRLMQVVETVGAWTLNHNVVRGWPLAVVWLGESVLILGLGILLPIKMQFNEDPVCECGTRCKRVGQLPRFAVDRQQEFVTAVENRDYAAMSLHAAPGHPDDPELSLRLMYCPTCGQTNVLTVNQIAWGLGPNRQRTVQTTPLISKMLIPTGAVSEIRTICDQIRADRESANAQETAPPGPGPVQPDKPVEERESAGARVWIVTADEGTMN